MRLPLDAAASIDAAFDGADAVVIAATTTAHPGLIRQGIQRGLPTFCEKPLAADLEETIAIAAEIDASGIPFQLGFQRRFDAGYAEAHRLIQSGALGTLYNIRLAGHDPAPPHEAYIAQSGGLFRDFSVHDFDVLRFMTGCEVEEVYADGAVRRGGQYEEGVERAPADAAARTAEDVGGAQSAIGRVEDDDQVRQHQRRHDQRGCPLQDVEADVHEATARFPSPHGERV